MGASTRAFSVYWTLKGDAALKAANVAAMDLAKEVETLSTRFPNAGVNPDEQRRLRASLYRPLLALGNDDRARLVDLVMATLFA